MNPCAFIQFPVDLQKADESYGLPEAPIIE